MNRKVFFCYKVLVDSIDTYLTLWDSSTRVCQDAECGIQLISVTLAKGLHCSHRTANGLCT